MKDLLIGKGDVGPRRDDLEAVRQHPIQLVFLYEPGSRAGKEHLGSDIPNGTGHFFEGQHSVRVEDIALLGEEHAADLVESHALRSQDSTHPVDDACDYRSLLCEVQCRCSTHVAPALDKHALALDCSSIQRVEVPDGFRNTVSGNEIGHPVADSPAVRQEFGILHHLAHPLPKVPDAPHLLRLIRLEMAVEYPLLWMPDATGLRHRNHFLAGVDVEVASGSIVVLEQGGDRLIPAAQNALLSGVVRVEVYAALGPADLRSTHGELDFHRLGERDDLAPVQARAHPGSSAGCTASEAVDHHPTTGFRLGVRPFEDDFGWTLAVAVEQILHLGVQRGTDPFPVAAKLPKSVPPHTSAAAPVTEAREVVLPWAVRQANQAKAAASLPSTQR